MINRFYYFKKHYGLFQALTVELFARLSKEIVTISLILLLAGFLRFYRLEENLVFHGELGQNYLDIQKILDGSRTWLLGPRTSHEWLYFGPLFYWLMTPFMSLLRFTPVIGACLFAFLGLGLVGINYFYVKKWLGSRIALISSLLIAISPAFVALTRESRFFSLVVILFYPLVDLILTGRTFTAGLVFGIMLNFHYSVLIMVPWIVYSIYRRRGGIVRFFIGLTIPLLPLVYYDFTKGLLMTGKIILWMPYRLAGFIGIWPKNNLTWDLMVINFASLEKFLIGIFIK